MGIRNKSIDFLDYPKISNNWRLDADEFCAVGADFLFHFDNGASDDFTVVGAVFFKPVSGLSWIGNHIKFVKLDLGKTFADSFADTNL